MSHFFAGMTFMGCLTAGLFYLRFWKDSRERLFLIFALAFVLFGLDRIVFEFAALKDETLPYAYLIRFVGFLMLAAGIIDKNRRRLKRQKLKEETSGQRKIRSLG